MLNLMLRLNKGNFFPILAPILAIGLSLGLGGCAATNEDASVRGVAASWVAGRAFDRASLAMRRDNPGQLERAGTEMSRAASAGSNPRLVGALVQKLSGEADILFQQSTQLRGDERIRFAENSNARYRSALAFVPQDAPGTILDAQALNSLGYFLADRGSTREDFERAAVLTQLAVQKWDISGKTPGATELDRATGPQDSHAWSLFKLGKYEAARVQQEKVWDMVRAMGDAPSAGGSADIPFHLAEIYRALGRDKRARETYEAALARTPSKSLRVTIQGRLQALELARV